jgi:hypothetical protein
MKQVTRDGRRVYVAGRWREISPATPPTTEHRAQQREFLQSQADGPILNASQINRKSDVSVRYSQWLAATDKGGVP